MTDQSTVTSLWASVTSWLTLTLTPTPTSTTLFLFLNLVIGTIAVTTRFTSNKRPQQHQLGSHDSPGQHQHQLARAPSLLDRVKSINFSLYKFPSHEHEPEPDYFHQPIEPTHPVEPEQPPQLARAPSLLDRVKSINFLAYKFPNLTQEEEPNWFHQPYDSNPVEPEQPRLARAPSLLERVKSIRLPFVSSSQEMETDVMGNEETETYKVHKPKRSKSETKKSKTEAKENMKKSVSEKSMKVETTEEETEMVERMRPQTARLERTETIGDGDHGVDAKADDFINKFKRQLRLQRLDSLLRYREILQGK